MYSHDDKDSAKLPERIFAAVVAGACGYFVGWFIAFVAVKVTGGGAWFAWVTAVVLAVYGFIAPSRSRDLLTEFWNEVLGFFLKGK